jgi:N utilization substance protein A
LEVKINERKKQAVVTAAEDQLSLAIGKEGQNVRLAAKLTGHRIDIQGPGVVAEIEPEKLKKKSPSKKSSKKVKKEVRVKPKKEGKA